MRRKRPASSLSRVFIVAVALLSLVGGYYWGNHYARPDRPLNYAARLPQPAELAPFELVDHNENRLDNAALAGRWTLAFFGYTHCPDICPTALTSIAAAYKQLLGRQPDLAERLRVLFVSVDPKRDTPAYLKDYVGFFHPDFVGATGSEAEIAKLARQLNIAYELEPPNEKGEYLVNHSAWLVLISPDGRYTAIIGGTGLANPTGLAADLETLIAD